MQWLHHLKLLLLLENIKLDIKFPLNQNLYLLKNTFYFKILIPVIFICKKSPWEISGPGWSWIFYPKLQIPDPGFQVLIPRSWPFDLRSQVFCFELQNLGVRQFSNYIKVPQLLQSLVVITMWDRKLLQSVTGIVNCDIYYKVRWNRW